MPFRGPSIGPWQIAEVDIHLVNEIFRQIEEQIKQLVGLAGPINLYSTLVLTDAQYATTTEIADVAAAESAGISDLIPRGDHVHAHGTGYLPDAHHTAFEALQADGVDVSLASRKINLIAGSNVTLTPAAGSITIASSGGGASATGTEGVTDIDGCETSQPWDFLLAGTGITLTELADGHALSISARSLLTNGDTDTPELIFASGDIVYA